jgi:long-subunit fatty acid transport protein
MIKFSKLYIFISLIFLSTNAWSSFPELFGASYTTSMIGNQSNLDPNDPSNNYYSPAILAFTQKVNVLLQATSTAPHFDKINNVVVTNSINSTSGTTYGSVDTNYVKFYGGGLHFGLPIGYPEHGTIGTLGLSVYLPIGSIIETNSGNPFLPEYVMYHSRFQRTSLYFNFAHKSSDDFAWSLGGILGFQASAEVKANLSLNGNTFGSWAQAKTKINPSLGAIVSMAKKINSSTLYFTYQQEMKSNLDARATGEINNPSLGLFDANIQSVIFYEPHTFRLGSNLNMGDFNLYGGVEYQIWSAYKPPVIEIVKNGGVVDSSSNYEHVSTQDTINPRLGVRYQLTNRVSLGLGYTYRPTPLKGDFSGSGNSIDTNTHVFTTGFNYRIVVWSKDVSLGSSLEYHLLEDRTVTKSANQENGNSGIKIGGPSYSIGGYLLSASVGLKFNF